ncbi:MAG: TetR/AcrR family transcriptional regulator [Pseudomonadota bacterium]
MARPRAKDHDDKRKMILATAAEVFASRGIVGASMNEVAANCGISKANIYHYYASKNDLIFDILDTYLAELRDVICGIDLKRLQPEDQLHTLTRAFLLAYEGMDNEHKIQSEGIPLLDDTQQKVLKAYQKDLVARMAATLRDCAPDTLNNKAKCRDVTMSVFGMLNWFYMWNPQASKEERIAYAATIANLTLHGVRPKVTD